MSLPRFREVTRTVTVSYAVPLILVCFLGFAFAAAGLAAVTASGHLAGLLIALACVSILTVIGITGYTLIWHPEMLRSERSIDRSPNIELAGDNEVKTPAPATQGLAGWLSSRRLWLGGRSGLGTTHETVFATTPANCRTFIIVVDAVTIGENFASVAQFIASAPVFQSWWNHLPYAFLVATDLDAAGVSESLRSRAKDARFLVTEVNLADSEGRLPRVAWDWIRRRDNPAEFNRAS
jgi:hypothetical protein